MTGRIDIIQIYSIRDKTLFGMVGSSHLIPSIALTRFKFESPLLKSLLK